MRFDEERKKAILFYILEKIEQGDTSLSKAVADNFDINQSTVHAYMKELVEEGVIQKERRGLYRLQTQEFRYVLKRSAGDLDSDIKPYQDCLFPHIRKFAGNIDAIWAYSFSEMINNVIDHSGAETATITVVQNYLKTSVRIEDDGVGIFRKIKDFFGYATTEEAICELFKGKLTTDAKNHSGEEIFFSSKLMDDFLIVSDNSIFTCNKYDDHEIKELTAKETNGTCVMMSLSNFSKKEPADIFDAYTDEEGGFTRTRIPLKHIFDAAPVSRSQAKRICNGLSGFKEVIFDFDEISWMGQGFAHQIFSVFAQEHKEMTLIPENMNESVEKMYRHVCR